MIDEYAGLIRAICDRPDDPLPRLVYADKLQEGGEDERAEFIRVQCELAKMPAFGPRQFDPRYLVPEPWESLRRRERELEDIANELPPEGVKVHYRRGFIDEIRLPLVLFMGGFCRAVQGSAGMYDHCDCGECDGDGRIEGRAKALFENHPISRVVLTDREPYHSEGEFANWWLWHHDATRPNRGETIDDGERLPVAIYDLLSEQGRGTPLGSYHKRQTGRYSDWAYSTQQDAIDAISGACVSYGRSLAGLSPLTPASAECPSPA